MKSWFGPTRSAMNFFHIMRSCFIYMKNAKKAKLDEEFKNKQFNLENKQETFKTVWRDFNLCFCNLGWIMLLQMINHHSYISSRRPTYVMTSLTPKVLASSSPALETHIIMMFHHVEIFKFKKIYLRVKNSPFRSFG